jgi:hypothetical protein
VSGDCDWLNQVKGVSAAEVRLSEESLRERLEVEAECDWRSSQCFWLSVCSSPAVGWSIVSTVRCFAGDSDCGSW